MTMMTTVIMVMVMTAAARRSRRLILVRNHEPDAGAPFSTDRESPTRDDGAGGTTNLIFDASRGRWEAVWSSLAGTSATAPAA